MFFRRSYLSAILLFGFLPCAPSGLSAQPAANPPTKAEAGSAGAAKVFAAQHRGNITLRGVHDPVEVIRDKWGVAHIYALSTRDLFFAQGFVAAQDHLWQMELWRRAGEGTLAEVLGTAYLASDKLARTLKFRGDLATEMGKYHPDTPAILEAYVDGVNEAIAVAIEESRVPGEFVEAGFVPKPVWTVGTLLTRLPAWRTSPNLLTELTRALAARAVGVTAAQASTVTEPAVAWTVPVGLDLADFGPPLFDLLSQAGGRAVEGPMAAAGGSAWVVGGKKSVTGFPLLAADLHLDPLNPAPSWLVHLVAPGWNVVGLSAPGLPGISAGHNEDIAWASTPLGADQQDLYVEETDPANPNRYLADGQWQEMTITRELIRAKSRTTQLEVFEAKSTRHGPVIFEDKARHRAYALRWSALDEGGAPGLGGLNVLQARNWADFTRGVGQSPWTPGRSLVYADKTGNHGLVLSGLVPVRKNWDGLLPVPGNAGSYEWTGFISPDKLPQELNGDRGFYALAGNDVISRYFPGAASPLGFDHGPSYRFDRISEVLDRNGKFTVADLEQLQDDEVSLPARALVTLLKPAKSPVFPVQEAIDRLLAWDGVVNRDSVAATIYEYWVVELTTRIYARQLPAGWPAALHQPDLRQVIAWLTAPDAAFGPDPAAARDRLVLASLEQALLKLEEKFGADRTRWRHGDLHRVDFTRPLVTTGSPSSLAPAAVPRGGDGANAGAAGMLVMDVQDWDRSVAFDSPGNESKPAGAHSAALVPARVGEEYLPLLFTRTKVLAAAVDKATLHPWVEHEPAEQNAAFQRVQTDLFTANRPVTQVWGDYDNDGWPDLFVGYQGGPARLFHNASGRFVEVTLPSGINDTNEIRSAAWGDFDGDGCLDLYIGFGQSSTSPNRLYRGDGQGHFKDVAREWSINDWGESRQVCFVDFNNDGRVDLFVGFREKANRLYRNDGDHFTEVSTAMGIVGPQSTVGGVWFDYNEDGRLDLFLANQSGTLNRVYRNDGDHFTNVAAELGLDGRGRTSVIGSVGIAVGDFNGDGRLDLYYANYGPSWLMRNDGLGKFTDVAPGFGVVIDQHLVAVGWGDYDNDGRPDLYTCGYLLGHPNTRDYLLRNEGTHFSDGTPGYMLKHDSDHGVAWADYDRDGALDLVLCDHEATGVVSLYHNQMPTAQAARSLQVLVLNAQGHCTKAGAEVRVYAAGTRRVLGAGLVDSGSGYSSQSVLPVHFGLPAPGKVDIEVTTMSTTGRRITRVADVDPAKLGGRALAIKTTP